MNMGAWHRILDDIIIFSTITSLLCCSHDLIFCSVDFMRHSDWPIRSCYNMVVELSNIRHFRTVSTPFVLYIVRTR